MSEQTIDIKIKNNDKLVKLREALANGEIGYQSSVSNSSMISDKHEQIIDNWIKRYDQQEKEISDNLEELKLASDDSYARNYSYGVIPDEEFKDENCAIVTAFVCWFDAQNKHEKRKYCNSNVRVKLNSNTRDECKINKYPLELAAIVLDGKVPNLLVTYI
ncbi:22558_t:CDS:1 [Gigaspora margarita]|uniref:22558_t:CDS:1 n=1 Tax=Gigaspora margarita TaxID=4874 RepID=A0ABN7WGU5_GIGMA|nr:22558_t:CDS:1 [Gigaspora margarita]